MTKQERVAKIIELWPSSEAFSADLGLKRPEHGRTMKKRGSIPKPYWPLLIEKAKTRGIRITKSQLESAHSS